MKSIKMFFFSVITVFALAGCEDEPSLGDAPTAADAEFTYAPSGILATEPRTKVQPLWAHSL